MKILLLCRKMVNLAGNCSDTLAPLGEVLALDFPRGGFHQPSSLRQVVMDANTPDLIINPAAYTAVDKAESER